MDAKKGDYVDHINFDTMDNRRENLRITNNSENLRNRSGENGNRNNTSGYRIVSYSKTCKKWIVQMQIQGKNTCLGKFDDVHEAGLFAEKMREQYYSKKLKQ